MIGSQAKVTYLDYSDVPLINQDIEFPEPETVGRLRATVKEADVMEQQTGIVLNQETWTEGRMILTEEQIASLKAQTDAFLKFIG